MGGAGSRRDEGVPTMNHDNGWTNHGSGWMNSWSGGGMWIWPVIGVLVIVLLVIAIMKMSNKKS